MEHEKQIVYLFSISYSTFPSPGFHMCATKNDVLKIRTKESDSFTLIYHWKGITEITRITDAVLQNINLLSKRKFPPYKGEILIYFMDSSDLSTNVYTKYIAFIPTY